MFELDAGGQFIRRQETKGKYTKNSVLHLCSKIQNTPVIRTSPATVWSVNNGRDIDLAGMMLPPSIFTTIESGWLVCCKLEGSKTKTMEIP